MYYMKKKIISFLIYPLRHEEGQKALADISAKNVIFLYGSPMYKKFIYGSPKGVERREAIT